jgi:hypothetical protein
MSTNAVDVPALDFRYDAFRYYFEKSKNIHIIPGKMNSLRSGGATSSGMVFNVSRLFDNVEVLINENSKFTRKPHELFISDLQRKGIDERSNFITYR